jgi:hypothetical protein
MKKRERQHNTGSHNFSSYVHQWLVLKNNFFINYFQVFFFYCCANWVYTVAFTKVLTIYQIYHTWVHHFHYSSSCPPPPTPGIVSTDIIFPFTYMYLQYLHHIHPPSPFPHSFPLLLVPASPRQDLFCPLLLWYCIRKEENKRQFWLFKIATQGVSFWHFHVYV